MRVESKPARPADSSPICWFWSGKQPCRQATIPTIPTRPSTMIQFSRTPRPLSARLRHLALAACAGLLLSACGGGGGSDAGNTSAYNLDAAITRALVNGVQIDGLTGSLNGVAFTLSVRFIPLADAVFEGAARKAVRQTFTITGGGATDTTSGVSYFGVSPYADVGAVDEDGGIDVSAATGTLPTAVRTGSAGPLSTTTSYADATRARIDSTSVTTWSLDADGQSNALACLRTATTDTGAATPATGQLCLRINTAGDVLGAVVTIADGGIRIEFR